MEEIIVTIDLTDIPEGEEWVLMNGEAVRVKELTGGWWGEWFIGWCDGKEYPVFPPKTGNSIKFPYSRVKPWMPPE